MDRVIQINYPTPKVNPIASTVGLDTEITRMDFVTTPRGVIVNKLGKNWNGRLVVVTGETKPAGFNLEKALAWCESQGWTVRRWPGGARAWKYGLEPVRSKSQVISLRDDLRQNPRPELQGQAVGLDLLYDL